MKKYQLMLIMILILGTSCRTKKVKTQIEDNPPKVETEVIKQGTNVGQVSHQYKSDGCKSIIIIDNVDGSQPQILIPIKGLESDFDVDGMNITFDFILSRVKQPEGCKQGQPAILSNVQKK